MINGKLTSREVADILGMKNTISVTNLVCKGKLHGEKVYIPAEDNDGHGRMKYLFDESEVMKYMEDMATKVDKGKRGHKFEFLKTKEQLDENTKELTRNVTGGPIMKNAHVDISEEGMRFTAYGKPIGKDPKECSAPVTPLDKRHLFANSNGVEKFVGDELESKFGADDTDYVVDNVTDYSENSRKNNRELEKKYVDSDIKACDEAKNAINNVFGLNKTIKVDGKCDIHIDIDARVIAHKYIKSLSDEEFVELFRHALKERLK